MQNKKLTDKSSLNRKELIFLITAAIVTITISSTCSPLYPFNPWDDTNCFFTLGRGIIHGLVPYRDLYEQKGPLLYFIYACAALISEKSFIGAWIIECVMASLYAVFSWKIAKLFAPSAKLSIILIPVLIGLVYSSRLFNFGGNAEELCFPLLTVALYFGLRAIVNGDGLPSNTEALVSGIMTASLFWIKYTFIGFMAGFCIYILIISIKNKCFSRLWSLVWRFIAGFLIISIPILIYFLATNSLNDLWEAYFYNNIFFYHGGKIKNGIMSIPVIKNIYIPVMSTYVLSTHYPKFGIMLLVSAISPFFIDKKHIKKSLLLFYITFTFTAGLVFTRNTNMYYYLYLLAYCFGLILIPIIRLSGFIMKYLKENKRFISYLGSAFLIICYAIVLLTNKNSYLIFQSKDFLVQYRYAEIIKGTPNAKVLTYDVMDSGFYTAAGLLPQNKYFCFLNIETNFPPILEEQERLIEEGYFDYIITTFFCEKEMKNYKLIAEDSHIYVDYTGEKCRDGFRLYKRV